ncbi:MAG: hypothetical protein R3C68_15785 [Myxococcota bacterium]
MIDRESGAASADEILFKVLTEGGLRIDVDDNELSFTYEGDLDVKKRPLKPV